MMRGWVPSAMKREDIIALTPQELANESKPFHMKLIATLEHEGSEVVSEVLTERKKNGSKPVKEAAGRVANLLDSCFPLNAAWMDEGASPDAPADFVLNKDSFHNQMATIDDNHLGRFTMKIHNKYVKEHGQSNPVPQKIEVTAHTDDALTPVRFVVNIFERLGFTKNGVPQKELLFGPADCDCRPLLIASLKLDPLDFIGSYQDHRNGDPSQEVMDLREHVVKNPLAAKLRKRYEEILAHGEAAPGKKVANLPVRSDPNDICVDGVWRWLGQVGVLVALTHRSNEWGVPHPYATIPQLVHLVTSRDNISELREWKKGRLSAVQVAGDLIENMAPLIYGSSDSRFFGQTSEVQSSRANKQKRLDDAAGPSLNIISSATSTLMVGEEHCVFCGNAPHSATAKCPWPNLMNFFYILPDQRHKSWSRGKPGQPNVFPGWTAADVTGLRLGMKRF